MIFAKYKFRKIKLKYCSKYDFVELELSNTIRITYNDHTIKHRKNKFVIKKINGILSRFQIIHKAKFINVFRFTNLDKKLKKRFDELL
jgi:hypothetical protein